MIDALTNFGTITTTSSTSPSEVKSDVIDLIAACDVKAGPHDARIVVKCTASSSTDAKAITVNVYGGEGISGSDIASPVKQLTFVPSLKTGEQAVVAFPLKHYTYMQLGITSAASVSNTVKAWVEFGA